MAIFDVFSGCLENGTALWIEAVEGVGNAADRMKQLATEKPGRYFVFSLEKRTVVVAIDSSSPQNWPEQLGKWNKN